MLNEQKVKRRKQGEHLEKNKTKIAIIEFILSNKKKDDEPGIPEPKIREHLERTYGMTDIENIRKHLKDLLGDKNKACLEKFPYKKSGLPNYWDITKIEHLKNISDKFHKIQLNRYEKSLMIILQKNYYDIRNLTGLEFYVQLLLSPSFFKACIRTNINILLERTWKAYTTEHSIKSLCIKDQLHACYISYIARYPNFKMSYKSFVSMLTQMSRKDISSVEKFMKTWEEELLLISKEESDEIHRETIEKDLSIYRHMCCVASELRYYKVYEDKCFGLLFGHYLFQDILDGVTSSEGMIFAKHKNTSLEYKIGMSSEECRTLIEKRYLGILEQISIILAKHKHPSIFGNIYDNPTDTFNGLTEILNKNHAHA